MECLTCYRSKGVGAEIARASALLMLLLLLLHSDCIPNKFHNAPANHDQHANRAPQRAAATSISR